MTYSYVSMDRICQNCKNIVTSSHTAVLYANHTQYVTGLMDNKLLVNQYKAVNLATKYLDHQIRPKMSNSFLFLIIQCNT
jgi:hypothetical protein